VPRVARYFANRSSARYERGAFEEYTKRHAKRGGTATPWSNLEVSSAARRSFVSRLYLRESLLSSAGCLSLRRSFSPPPPPPLSLSLSLSLCRSGSLSPALNPRGFAHMSTIYFLAGPQIV